MKSERDLTILGGGLAGLSLALQCRQTMPQAQITVLEKKEHPAPEATFKVGESTVEAAAHYFAQVLGLESHILESQLPKLGLRFFFPADDNSRIEDRLELGSTRFAPTPSYQLDRGRFENYLASRCLEQGISFIDGANVEQVELGGRRKPHSVTYQHAGESHTTNSRWIVDASGRRAILKRKLNLDKPAPHIANAAWFRVKGHVRVDDWSDDPDWSAGHEGDTARFYSTNHLMGEGYWVWLIPLASGYTSIGIVAAEEFHQLSSFNTQEKALDWLERHEPQCASAITGISEGMEDFHAIKHYALECKQVFSARRWGITGEAGFFLDPFYSPGSDFIAFANTFLNDLICRDLSGKSFGLRAFIYDRVFKRFFYGTAVAFQDQYQLFGNAQIMPVKILWDYLIYWSITGYIFLQDRMPQHMTYIRNISNITRLGKVNHFMQDFFRQWHQQSDHSIVGAQVDISSISAIHEWNLRLSEDLSNGAFFRQFADNADQMEKIAGEIVEHAGIDIKVPFKQSRSSTARAGLFEHVLNPRKRRSAGNTAQSVPV